MTGLLGRLAAQAAGVPPLVRPRPRSRFEPEAGASGPGGLVELNQEILAEARPELPPMLLQQSPQVPAHARVQTEPVVRDGAVPNRLTGRRGAEPPIDTPGERTSARQPGSGERADTASARRTAEDVPLAPAQARSSADLERLEQIVIVGSQPAAEQQAIAIPTPSAAAEPKAHDPAHGLLTTSQTVLAPVPARGSQPAPERGERRAPEPAAQPEIHVTIGRLEVRAPAPPQSPAPAPPAPASSPGLGLGDYLRERAEGSRR